MQEQPANTLVTFSLDANGWMELLKGETIAGVNAFLDTLERDAGDLVELTWLEYNDAAIETFCADVTLPNVRRLTSESHKPQGGPALVDGWFAAVRAAEDAIVRRRGNRRVVVVFHTGSDDHLLADERTEDLQALIARRKAEGWQFILLGAEVCAYSVASDLGLDHDTAISCSGLPGTVQGMTTVAEIVGTYARGRSDVVRLSDDQRQAAGDCYYGIDIGDEAIERAMRVYTHADYMEYISINQPRWSATTAEWEAFLSDLQAREQTPAVQRAIENAERELARRAAGPQPPLITRESLERTRRLFEETAPIKVPGHCACAGLCRPPHWATRMMEDGEVGCCHLGIPRWIERKGKAPLCRVDAEEVYRISYEPTWGEHVSVCISRRGDDITFSRTVAASIFDHPERLEGVLTLSDWRCLDDALRAVDFWSLPRYVRQQGATLDGYEIIVEGRRGNLFKCVRLPNPDTDATWRIGRVAFDLTGLADKRL